MNLLSLKWRNKLYLRKSNRMIIRIRILLLFVLVFTIANTNASEIKYRYNDIPDSLLNNVKAVIRNYSATFNVINLDNISYSISEATTILTKEADKFAVGYFPYSPENDIQKIEVCFYDKEGKLFEKASRKDFTDKCYDSYGTLFSDSRYLIYKPLVTQYPYTVEYKITYKQKYTYSFPDLEPMYSSGLSIEYSSLKIVVPKDYNIQIKEYALPQKHTFSSEPNGTDIYFWEIKNMPADEYEEFAPDISTYRPYIVTAPSSFKYEDYSGDFSSWKNYGDFLYTLYKDRDILPIETILKIKELTKDAKTDLEKAQIIYEFVQNNTRYVNISEGIGGIQPFPAEVVDKNGYGDCKGLANYTKALLKQVDIQSYCCTVKGGDTEYEYDTSLICHQSNHIILFIPFENDTIWLDCTSQINPFGYLGKFTDNRYALVISKEGGKLLKTKEYKHTSNLVNRIAEITINVNGSAQANIRTSYSGLEYDDILGLLHEDYKTQKDYLYNKKIEIPDFKIDSFYYKDYPDINPKGEEYLYLKLTNYASLSGNRMFIVFNLMNRFDDIPQKDDNRKNPIAIYNDYIHTDSLIYTIPEGYHIELLPENTSILSDFGTVKYSFRHEGNKVVYTRAIDIKRNEFQKEKYNDFIAFCKNIKKSDNQKLILTKD
jgi:transglutaminase-like putative cysteine protease